MQQSLYIFVVEFWTKALALSELLEGFMTRHRVLKACYTGVCSVIPLLEYSPYFGSKRVREAKNDKTFILPIPKSSSHYFG